jgi:hypothetical protein
MATHGSLLVKNYGFEICRGGNWQATVITGYFADMTTLDDHLPMTWLSITIHIEGLAFYEIIFPFVDIKFGNPAPFISKSEI